MKATEAKHLFMQVLKQSPTGTPNEYFMPREFAENFMPGEPSNKTRTQFVKGMLENQGYLKTIRRGSPLEPTIMKIVREYDPSNDPHVPVQRNTIHAITVEEVRKALEGVAGSALVVVPNLAREDDGPSFVVGVIEVTKGFLTYAHASNELFADPVFIDEEEEVMDDVPKAVLLELDA